MKEKLVRWCKIVVATPIVFLWDIFFFLVEKLYEGCKFVDEKGGAKLEEFIDG